MKHKIFFTITLIIVFVFATSVLNSQSVTDVKKKLAEMNDQLAASGKSVRIEKVEFSTCDKVGPTVYANDRIHKLDSHWFPYDPWRFGSRDIYWATDNVDQVVDISWADADAAIGRAMNTWNTTQCANIPLVEVNDSGLDLGYVQYLVGMGGVAGWLADITHAGWLSGTFFEIIGGPGGSDLFILSPDEGAVPGMRVT